MSQSSTGVPRGARIPYKGSTALLLDSQDYNVFTMELPPLEPEAMEQAIRFRLRSQYPGNGDTEIDWRPAGSRAAGTYVTTTITRERLEHYVAQTDASRIVTGVDLAFATKTGSRSRVVVVADKERAHVFEFVNRSLSSARRGPTSAVAELVRQSQSRHDSELPVFVTGSATTGVEAALDAAGLPYESVVVESIVASLSSRHRPPFSRRSSHRAVWLTLITGVLLAAGFALLLTGALRWREPMRTEHQRVDRLLTEARVEFSTYQAALDEYDDVRATIGDSSSESIHPYRAASALATALDGLAQIERLVLQDRVFELQAVGPDALVVLERVSSSPLFASARLRQIVPDTESGLERFSLQGTIND